MLEYAWKKPIKKEAIMSTFTFYNLGRSLKIAQSRKSLKNIDLAGILQVFPQEISRWRTTGIISKKHHAALCIALNISKFSEFVALGEDE